MAKTRQFYRNFTCQKTVKAIFNIKPLEANVLNDKISLAHKLQLYQTLDCEGI
jgi:hypothetical protein